MKYFLGAYASSPNVSGWDAEIETQYYQELKKLDNVAGLEHPFTGKLHNHDEEWFLNNIDPNWEYVFTCIPGIMGAIGDNPKFGIASTDEEGRQAALKFLKSASDAVEKLTSHLGKKVVRAVQIQTSPNQAKAPTSTQALAESLKEILSWDWSGAQIVIEHCDAFVEGQDPSKGFMALNDEITTIQSLSSEQQEKLGICINWGRSAIETRSAQGALDHVKLTKESGLLKGLMFSGASDKESDYGIWKDSHMPQGGDSNVYGGEPASLMTAQEIKKCIDIAEADSLLYLGLKIGIRPRELSGTERVTYNKSGLALLDAAI